MSGTFTFDTGTDGWVVGQMDSGVSGDWDGSHLRTHFTKSANVTVAGGWIYTPTGWIAETGDYLHADVWLDQNYCTGANLNVGFEDSSPPLSLYAEINGHYAGNPVHMELAIPAEYSGKHISYLAVSTHSGSGCGGGGNYTYVDNVQYWFHTPPSVPRCTLPDWDAEFDASGWDYGCSGYDCEGKSWGNDGAFNFQFGVGWAGDTAFASHPITSTTPDRADYGVYTFTVWFSNTLYYPPDSWQSQGVEIGVGDILTLVPIHYQTGGGSAVYTFSVTVDHPVSPTARIVFSQNSGASPEVISIDTLCYESSLSPISSRYCSTVPNPDFADAGQWALSGDAFLHIGLLSLASGQASQDLASLPGDASYTAEISATSETAAPLVVSLASATRTVIISGPGVYSATFSSLGSVTGTVPFTLTGTGASLSVDFVCLRAAYATSECIAPINGTFDDSSAWSFYHGASWNAGDRNALLPIQSEGAISQAVTLPVLPDVQGGNYWILSFDARSKYGDGAAYVSLDGPDFIDSFTFTLGTALQTYQVDASAYQESTWGLYFANLNLAGVVTSASDVFVDNVCLHWSPDAPRPPPTPTGPPQVRPVPTITLTIDVTCSQVSQWLTDNLGINFTALEQEQPPTDMGIIGSWVWWLATRLWLYVAKPIICFLLFLWNLLAGILQTIVNFVIENVINPILENVANPALLWLWGIYALLMAFLTDPWGTLTNLIRTIWDDYIWPTIEPVVARLQAVWNDVIWLILRPFLQPLIDTILALWNWVQNTLWPFLQNLWNNPLGTIDQLISDMLQTLIDWLFSILQPVFDVLRFLLWLVARFGLIILAIVWPLWWAWDFIRTLIPGLISGIGNSSQVTPLQLGDLQVGFDFVNSVVSSTPLGILVLVVNGILWFVLIRWSIAQFSSLNT